MISYLLRCASGHEFEAWFPSSGAYDEQRASGDVDCPLCGDQEIVKAPMAPNVASRKESMRPAYEAQVRENLFREVQSSETETSGPQASGPQVSGPQVSGPQVSGPLSHKSSSPDVQNHEVRANEVAREIVEAANKLRDHVVETCDDVGTEFAEEARKIHYGEAEERGIYGEATLEETESLSEEGIDVFRLPASPRRKGQA